MSFSMLQSLDLTYRSKVFKTACVIKTWHLDGLRGINFHMQQQAAMTYVWDWTKWVPCRDVSPLPQRSTHSLHHRGLPATHRSLRMRLEQVHSPWKPQLRHYFFTLNYFNFCPQRFEAVASASGRATGLQWVMSCWHDYLSAVRRKWFAYGPDVTRVANLNPSLTDLKYKIWIRWIRILAGSVTFLVPRAYANLNLSLKTGPFGVLPSKSFRLVLKKPNLIQQNHTHNCKPKTLQNKIHLKR